jgi:hypothetical protein
MSDNRLFELVDRVGQVGAFSFSSSDLLANPDATFVAGFKAWLELGYCVRKAERAIRIFVPMPVKLREQSSEQDSDQTRLLFRVVSVFDPTAVQDPRHDVWIAATAPRHGAAVVTQDADFSSFASIQVIWV